MVKIVAEISANHQGKLEQAKALIWHAKNAGADAVKIQTFTPDSLTIDCNKPHFIVQDPQSPWYGRKLYDLYREGMTPREWHSELFNYAKEIDITLFSSPFSKHDVDFLENLNCPMYKIASFEANHPAFISYVASTRKPIIISTGVLSLTQMNEAISAAKSASKITLLHCVSRYPLFPEDAHLNQIPNLKSKFPDCDIGFSDHSLGRDITVAAVALGAKMIEKHITINRDALDGKFALTPIEFQLMVNSCRIANLAVNPPDPFAYFRNKNSPFARSIFVGKDIEQGEEIKDDNIVVVRPGMGIPPSKYPEVIGMRAKRFLGRGTPLAWGDLG